MEPAVSTPLLVLGGQFPPQDLEPEYERWKRTADVFDAEMLAASTGVEIAEYFCMPDREELLAYKWFSQAAATPVAAYGAETFGGTPEYEWAWLFSAADDRVLLLTWTSRQVDRVVRSFFRTRTEKATESGLRLFDVTRTSCSDASAGSDANVFERVAAHLGVRAPSGYSQPHTRGFDWSRYSVPARA